MSILHQGSLLKFHSTAEKKLDATFVIHMPLTNARSKLQNTVLPLCEVSNGTYEGYWTATSTAKAKGAVIEVIIAEMIMENVTRQKALGTLNINKK
ncbi:hypothetical protein ACEQPO_12355 [Bacillus sp. SL00103]